MKLITTFKFNENTIYFSYISPTPESFGIYIISLNGSPTDYELVIGESGEEQWMDFYNGNDFIKSYQLHQTELTLDIVTDIYKILINNQ